MAFIIETPNAFQPLVGMKKHKHPGGITIRGWLESTYPGFIEFENPTVCILNGVPLMRKDWSREIRGDDVINFVGCVGYVGLVIALVIAIIAIVLVTVLLAPTTPGELPASDPVFSTNGQKNAIRLGEPIEVNYGRNRIYPSLASRPFFRYFDNDQFQYSLFCIGQGYYDVEQILIGNTDIGSFQEVEYELLDPGDSTTLFRTNVFTSPEAGGQTLFATNEPEFVAPGWVGPFVADPTGTTVNRIEIDLSYPRGVYHQKKKSGDMQAISLTVEFQKRLIDDSGNPLGPFTSLFTYTLTAATTTPQRKTRAVAVAAGRYEVRGRYSGFKPLLDTRTGYVVVWEGMRGFIIGNEPDFGNVTLLAVKIKATNNLNSRTQEQFNVIATRKLPIRDSSGGPTSFTDPVPTRSIVWAFVDIFRSNYGARITDDRFFDWDTLEALDAYYESRNEHFDWTFRDAITIWEAAKAIARVGRAIPLLSGSKITLRRDGPLEVPVTLFSPDNMVKGSFTWDIKLWEPNEFDSVSVEYTDPDTGYKQEQVLCVLPDSNATTDNPEEIRIPGIQDRNHAYREGLYYLAVKRFLRENMSFDTGLEGYIPSYGDLVAVAHDVPRWGQSGYILAVEDESNGIFRLHVSEPLSFEASGQIYQIILRGKAGEVIGPFTAIETADPKVVIIDLPEQSEEFDFLLGGTTEPMLFLFGVAGTGTKYGKVVRMEPQGGERIKMTLVGEEPIIHSFDSLEAPALHTPSIPPEVPDLPIIPSLVLTQLDGDLLVIQASWLAAFGAQYYVVQSSNDGENWEVRGTTERTSMQFQVLPGLIRVRVAGVNNGQGPWVQAEIQIGLVAGLHIYDEWDDDLEWGVRWWPKINSDGWIIRVYDNTNPLSPVLKRTHQNDKADLQFDYDYLLATSDNNLHREMLFKVDTLIHNDDTGLTEEEGFPGRILLSNPIPAQPIHLGHEFIGEESGVDGYVYRLFWDNPPEVDLKKVKVFIAKVDISAFDETEAQLVYQQTASTPGYTHVSQEAFIVIPDESEGGHDLYFWWVVVFDIWGNEITSNISDPSTLPALVFFPISGVVAHWRLDEAGPGTRAELTNTYPLTDVGNSTGSAAGKFGTNAAQFGSSSSGGDTLWGPSTPPAGPLTFGDNDFSIAGWVWLDDLNATGIIGKWNAFLKEWIINFDGTDLQFLVSSNGTAFHTVTNPASISTGQWYFIVAWHDHVADTINLQVNDGTVSSQAHSGGTRADGTTDLYLGHNELTDTYLDGRLESFTVWNRTLTPTERTTLYNAGAGRNYPD
jgi:hypothetical protein